MNERLEQKETRGLKTCLSCGFEMREQDRYCRRCGTRWNEFDAAQIQVLSTFPAGSLGLTTAPLPTASTGTSLAIRPTSELPVQTGLYRPVSGSLVNAFASSMTVHISAALAEQLKGGAVRRVMAALLSLPLWLMIILLSPLDAYLASRSLLRQF